ncbi:MAG: ABC-type alpha-glucoside uptake system substrate-binding component AglE [Roseibaca calidilacus]|uniref:ABC-type alpha-glucoside uptake system substrate-binding component AglE n=1 Tax=Roseibaca calidilacus TaxID=1666912 RepID=A0A0N8K7J5_9RHOB|nr:ABC transporter substrate-binding protein [Roseibaca calidilacus]KPP91913.1 MAG: ABC-type alpha-glucoside uptake system substrate-binding component AglE [Roseibaca calidilacus]CUX82303.1 maltose-binding protein /trehalose-binding protein /sucrose-binding protein [Roseibaca calidilacus]
MKSRLYTGVAVIALVASGASAQDLLVAPGEGAFTWDSYTAFADATDLAGQTVTITGPWTGNEAEKVNKIFDYFEAATGATVDYSGSDSFEQDIVISTRAGSAPNLAVFPQPGLAADMAAQGLLTPLPEGTAEFVAENYAAGQSWVDLGTYADPDGNDQLYGLFYRVDLKSLVWYSPDAFDEMGYDIPETMEELKALTQMIVDDGGTPWCIGLGSGAATGWPATDWVEDMMLRTQPPEVYDAWVSNEMPFNDPAVIAAIEEFGAFARNDAFVQGGAQAVATTDFRDSPAGLFSIPPSCYMHRQASFIPAFFPDGTAVGEDVDFFYFPAFEEADLGRPVLGAGTLFAVTDPSDAATAMLEFLKLPIAHEMWMTQGGFLTAHGGVNLETYASDSERAQGEILANATTFRFDASDLMPGEIGAGAFWTGMVDYVTGASAEEVAADIQERWDTIK